MFEDSKNVTIPTWLYTKIEQRMPKEQFKSVSDYVCFVLTQVVSESEQKGEHSDQAYTQEDEEKVKDKLRALGYL
jgi:Arc/MetJ-type ribon-helix-helix transcriptional regulator